MDYDADDNSEGDDVNDDDDDDGRRHIYSRDSCSPAGGRGVASWSVQARDTDSRSSHERPLKLPVYIAHDADVDVKESSDSEEIPVNEGAVVRRAGSRLTYVEDDVTEHTAVRQRSSDRMPRGKPDAATHRQVTNLSPIHFCIISASVVSRSCDYLDLEKFTHAVPSTNTEFISSASV